MMNNYLQFLLFASLQGVVLALVIFFKKRNRLANKTLGILILTDALSIFAIQYHLHQSSFLGEFFVLFYLSLPYLVSPLFYCYTSFSMKNNQFFPRKYILLFLPFCIDFILTCLKLYLKTGQERIDYFNRITKYGILCIKKDLHLYIIIFNLLLAIVIFKDLQNFKKSIQNYFSDVAKIKFQWLRNLNCFHLFICLAALYAQINIYLNNDVSGDYLTSKAAGLIIFILFIFYISINNQEVFISAAEVIRDVSEKNDNKQIYTKTYYEKHLKRIINHLEKNKSYLKADYTIKNLADDLLIPVHQISKILNSLLKKNFYMFINEYRIKAARKALVEYKGKKIIEIAFDVGFNSKSTFNEIFKKYIGVTPSQYRKQVLKKSG